MSILLNSVLGLSEKSLLPDWMIRYGIRYLCKRRLKESVQVDEAVKKFVPRMQAGPIAPVPEKANAQHYEVPAEFFELVLGPHRKYSGCYWEDQTSTLEQAEENSLKQVCNRAELRDGQKILELGCGWGSLSLWMASHYPLSSVTVVSNSAAQKQSIDARSQTLGLTNLEVITADMNDFHSDEQFDRVVSIEMFEHMRNWETLLSRVSNWLNDSGKLFMHVFSNQSSPYEFETEGSANWMGKYFFTGGIMPSHDLIREFDKDLAVEQDWFINGSHYAKTAEQWLKNLDQHRARVLEILAENYGAAESSIWAQRWRMFFMACAELFAYESGEQWGVSHYRLSKTAK